MAAQAVARAGAAREAPATGPVASPGLARLVGFAPLALFGALHWGALVTPKADGTMVLGVVAAVGAGLLLLRTGADARHGVRAAGAVAATFGLGLLALRAGGVPARLLRPDAWDELAAGLGQGMQALPVVTVPYRGADEWVRIALVASGLALTGAAALVAFWPRPAARTPGSSLAAAVLLGALYTIPIVEHGPRAPWFGGAVFCLLLGLFLWLERMRADQVGVGVVCLLAVTLAGAFVAPRLDGSRPWLDYEQIAEDLQPEKAATFSWNHTYGPMTWPRDGREVLRIRASAQAYWKTANLDEFDGLRWVDSAQVRSVVDTELRRRDWIETIRVVDRGLRSRQFIGAGHTLQILRDGPPAVSLEPGTWQTIRAPLEPGTSYRAEVYVPRPTERQLRTAGDEYPDFTSNYLGMSLPPTGLAMPPAAVHFAPFGARAKPDAVIAGRPQEGGGAALLGRSAYARVYALAQSLKAGAKTPWDFVQAVRERVQTGASYSETPPPARVPLVDFLFNSRLGYCQQFSGAMALLLRMGGIPARVAAGFSPGRFDRRRGEFIVRDDDAHSWVEAYFPGIGWYTVDPTPPAAPARSQTSDAGPLVPAQRPNFGLGRGGDRPLGPNDPGARPADTAERDWLLLGGLATLAVLALVTTIVLVRRGRDAEDAAAPELAELRRALRRTGRTPPAETTLSRLEAALGGSDSALGYLRAVRGQRYAGAPHGPTAQQRRALRRELAAGLGAAGRLRAWWALPPVTRRRGPYTG